LTWSLTDAQLQTLFNRDFTTREPSLRTALGNFNSDVNNAANIWDTLKGSEQGQVVYDLYFNNPALVGPGLKSALKAGDWAKADFEVTYRSNGDDLPGLARRRFSYDDAFGPWSGMSSDDASSYYQIWTQNKTLIQTYEGKYGSQRSIANNEFGLTGDQRIPLSLNDDLSTIRGVTFVNGRTVWNKSSTSFMDNSNPFPDFYIDNFECYNELPMVK